MLKMLMMKDIVVHGITKVLHLMLAQYDVVVLQVGALQHSSVQLLQVPILVVCNNAR